MTGVQKWEADGFFMASSSSRRLVVTIWGVAGT